MRTITKRSAAVTATVVGLVGASVAFAAWTSSGTGEGTIAGGEAKALVVDVTSTDALYPTATKNVSFTVTNPNPYDVALSQASFVGVTSNKPECNAVESVTGQTPKALNQTVAAGATSTATDFAVSMNNLAKDECQGATFTVTLKVDGASASAN